MSLSSPRMAQARGDAFNPQSPRSSPGGADSYKHEGTPDTRLTAFSPDENVARSTKFARPLGAGKGPLAYQIPATLANGYSHIATTLADKDPFTSSTTPGTQEQKLSATASTFHPFSVPLVVSSSSATTLPSIETGPTNKPQNLQSTIKSFSKDLGLSRYLAITSSIRTIYPADFEVFLMVCLLFVCQWDLLWPQN